MGEKSGSSCARRRIGYLDMAKGIGIIFVLIFHSCGIPYFDFIVKAFYMPMFFVISGYLHREEDGVGIKVLLYKRVKGLLMPYFLYNGFLAFVYLGMAAIGRMQWKEYFINLFGVLYSRYYFSLSQPDIILNNMGNSPLWFLTSLFTSYCTFYFLFWLKKKKGIQPKSLIPVLIGLTALFSQIPILLPWSLDTCFAGAVFMLCGYYLRQSEFLESKNSTNKMKIILVTCLVLVVIAWYNGGTNMAIRIYGEHGIISVFLFFITGGAGALTILYICKAIDKYKISSWLSYIGANTLPILGFHMLGFTIYDKIIECIVKTNRQNIEVIFIINALRIILVIYGVIIVKKMIQLIRNSIYSRFRRNVKGDSMINK